MARSSRRLLVALLGLAPYVRGEILRFDGEGALPQCAFQCKELYSAQYDCPDSASCFCASSRLPKAAEWACDKACPEEADREKVRGWLAGTCKRPTSSPTQTSSPTSKPTNNADSEEEKQKQESAKAVAWWKKNWPYFMLAFLLVTIPIMVFAFAGPVRKYFRERRIERRERRSGIEVPPYWVPQDSVPTSPPMAGLGKPSTTPAGYYRPPSGGFTAGFSGGLGSHSEVGAPSDYDGMGSAVGSSMVGSDVGMMGGGQVPLSTRQESWERRMREQHEAKAKKGFWPWQKKRARGGGDTSYDPVRQTMV